MIFSLTCLALLVSPDSAGGGLVRAHVNSRRRVLFSFFYLNIPSEYWYVYIFTYLGMSIQGIGWGGRYDFGFRCSNLGWLLKTKTLCPFRFFCSIFNICTMIEVSSEQSSSQLYMHSAAAAAAAALLVAMLLLLQQQQQQCCFFLLLFVIVCRTTKFVAASLYRSQCFLSAHSNAIYF